jgi:hypothetical protein
MKIKDIPSLLALSPRNNLLQPMSFNKSGVFFQIPSIYNSPLDGITARAWHQPAEQPVRACRVRREPTPLARSLHPSQTASVKLQPDWSSSILVSWIEAVAMYCLIFFVPLDY